MKERADPRNWGGIQMLHIQFCRQLTVQQCGSNIASDQISILKLEAAPHSTTREDPSVRIMGFSVKRERVATNCVCREWGRGARVPYFSFPPAYESEPR